MFFHQTPHSALGTPSMYYNRHPPMYKWSGILIGSDCEVFDTLSSTAPAPKLDAVMERAAMETNFSALPGIEPRTFAPESQT